jgi:O-antigen/teichoic acid export membrane protein
MAAPVTAPAGPLVGTAGPTVLRRLATDTGWMALVIGIPLLARVAATPVRVHLLSPAAFGDVALWSAAIAVVGGFALWPTTGLMRFLPAGGEADRAQVIRAWLLATTATAGLLVAGAGAWAAMAGDAWGWVAVILALEALIAAATSYARAVGRFRTLAAVALTAGLTGVAAGTLLIVPMGPIGVLVGWAAADLVAVILAGALVGPSILTGLRAGPGSQLARLARFSAPLAVSNGAWMLVTWIDRPLLAGLVTKAELGIYSLAYVLVAAPLAGLFTVLSSVTWNHAVSSFERDGYGAAAELLRRSARVYTATSVAVVVWLGFYGDTVLSVVAPARYAGASRHLVWLALGLWCFGLLPYRNQHLILWNRSGAATVSPLVALGVNVAAVCVLVPIVGAVGAAAATTAAYGSALAVATWLTRRDERVESRLPVRLTVGCLAATAAAAAAMRPVVDALSGRWGQAGALAVTGLVLLGVAFVVEGSAVRTLRRRPGHAQVVPCIS